MTQLKPIRRLLPPHQLPTPFHHIYRHFWFTQGAPLSESINNPFSPYFPSSPPSSPILFHPSMNEKLAVCASTSRQGYQKYVSVVMLQFGIVKSNQISLILILAFVEHCCI